MVVCERLFRRAVSQEPCVAGNQVLWTHGAAVVAKSPITLKSPLSLSPDFSSCVIVRTLSGHFRMLRRGFDFEGQRSVLKTGSFGI